jgi:hypothetical protein
VEVAALVLLAALGAVAFATSVPTLREAWAPGNRLSSLYAHVLVVGGVLSESTLIPSPALLRNIVYVGGVIIAALVVLGPKAARRRGRAPWIVLGLYWAWMFLVNAVAHPASGTTTALLRGIVLVALAAFAMLHSARAIRASDFFAATLTTAFLLSLFFLVEGHPFTECLTFKCDKVGAILSGPFGSGNYLGLVFSFLVGLTIAAVPTAKKMVPVILFSLAGLYLTFARTSLVAAGAALVASIAIAQIEKRLSAEPSRRHLAVAVAIFASAVPAAVGTAFLYTRNPDFLSSRGLIWMLGMKNVRGYEITGIGVDTWSDRQDTGDVSFHFTHSEYMLSLFGGGFIGIVLLALAVARIIHLNWKASGSLARSSAVPLIFMLGGIAEVVWNPLTIDGLTWMMLCTVALPLGPLSRGRGIAGPRVAAAGRTLAS